MINSPSPHKLILHFDIDHVIRQSSCSKNHFEVYELFSRSIWGNLEKNNESQPEQVTGWKMSSDSISKKQPQPQLVSYHEYLKEHVKPSQQNFKKMIQNVIKDVGEKGKEDLDKAIRNTTLSKILMSALKNNKGIQSQTQKKYLESGKYEILPAFYKLLLWLKKNKRNFAICLQTSDPEYNHSQIISELNLFFNGQHPLYNGKNGTPLVKMDGNDDTKNFFFFDTHFLIIYQFEEESQFIASFGTQQLAVEKDPEMLKQSLKSKKRLKVCENIEEIFKHFHEILDEGGFVYELNPSKKFFINNNNQEVYELYFSSNNEIDVFNYGGEKIQNGSPFYESVDEMQLLKDIDYFIRKVKEKEEQRIKQLKQSTVEEKNEEGEQKEKEKEQLKQNDAEYLKKHIFPLLEGALRQVDLLRPEDPIAMIALHCLKNQERVQ